MKNKIKMVSTLLVCVIVLVACQTAAAVVANDSSTTSLLIQEKDEESAPTNSIDTHKRVQDYALVNPKKIPEENYLESYIADLSGLDIGAINLLIDQSNDIGIDPFIVLGLIKVESDFNTFTVGSMGERGLGQLMANTAEPVANNLGIEYNPDKLFEPVYNILLFTTQLRYLFDFYAGDLNKTLTAYNRGQYGLEKYVASRGSFNNPASSLYSETVLEYASKFKYEFDN